MSHELDKSNPPRPDELSAQSAAELISGIPRALRKARKGKGLTLKESENLSGGRFKAVVIGSYERGDRALSLNRAVDLAELYGLSLDQLLDLPTNPGAKAAKSEALCLDIERLTKSSSPSLLPVKRFAAQVRGQRGDWNREHLTLRASDESILSACLGVAPGEFVASLSALEVLRRSN